MKTCTIIISHFESLNFLRCCVRQIKRFTNPTIRQKVIIVDQSGTGTHIQVLLEFDNDPEIMIVHTEPLYSGYGLDYVLRNVDIGTEYICQIHVDVVPLSKNWLLLPITLIEENNFSFVGQLQFISKPTDTIYAPSKGFFAMAQCFNVAKTETYKEMSLQAGFTRFHNRPQSGLAFENNDWAKWAEKDYHKRGSDDDVVAFHWQDKYGTSDKLGLAITGFIAPAYGRIIDDIVFHFGSCRESIGTGNAMGKEYKEFTRRINEDYNDELISEMVTLAKANKPPQLEILSRNYWDGNLKISFPTTEVLNNRIEELKR